ncbi:hypothetical protein [Streptomyces sp. NPDC059224]
MPRAALSREAAGSQEADDLVVSVRSRLFGQQYPDFHSTRNEAR